MTYYLQGGPSDEKMDAIQGLLNSLETLEVKGIEKKRERKEKGSLGKQRGRSEGKGRDMWSEAEGKGG